MEPVDFFSGTRFRGGDIGGSYSYRDNSEFANASGGFLNKIFKPAIYESARLAETNKQVEGWWPLVDDCARLDDGIAKITLEIKKQGVIINSPSTSGDAKRVATRYVTAYTKRIEEYKAHKKKLGCQDAATATREAELKSQLAAVNNNNAGSGFKLNSNAVIIGSGIVLTILVVSSIAFMKKKK